MARYLIAYVCPGPDWRHRSWVLGALASDESGCVVAPNPLLNTAEAAAATGVPEEILHHWADSVRDTIAHVSRRIYDQQEQDYVLVKPTDPRFLEIIAADSVKEWNFYYSEVTEQPGPAAAVAEQVASGLLQVSLGDKHKE